MKKLAVIILLTAAILGLVFVFGGETGQPDMGAYLRIHIRADSNREEDQRVKYQVRDRIVSYLTPVVAVCETKEAAIEAIGGRLREIEQVAQSVLHEKGFSYGARACLRKESFPTRVYREVTLEAGVYDALILELGSGSGDNWWCVVYPPMCFAGGNGNIVYKSKIAEIIDRFFAK